MDSLESNYAGVYEARLGYGTRPALLIVDFVTPYFDRDSPLFADVDAARLAAVSLLEAARAARIPIVFTRVVYQGDSAHGGVFMRKVPALSCFRVPGSRADWAAGLVPQGDEIIIDKQYPSAFFGTSLAPYLVASKVDTVIIAGLTTSGCVRASCVDTMSHGFVPIVVEQACGDRHPEPHRANLFDMNAKYADVVQLDDALAYLTRIAG